MRNALSYTQYSVDLRDYPLGLINSIINAVVQNVSTTKPEMKIVLPFKDHIAASVVGRQWRDLNCNTSRLRSSRRKG